MCAATCSGDQSVSIPNVVTSFEGGKRHKYITTINPFQIFNLFQIFSNGGENFHVFI